MASNNPNIKVTADTSQATAELNKLSETLVNVQKKMGSMGTVNKSLKNLGSSISNVGRSVSGLGAQMTVGVTAPIVATTQKILDVGSSLTAFEAKYTKVFKGLSGEASKWSASFGKSVGLNDTIIKKSLTSFQSYSQNMGMSGKEALSFSKKMTALTADLSAFNDVDMAEAGDRLMAIFRGEYDSAEALGLAINQTTLEQEMMKEGLKGEFASLSQNQKMMVLYNLALSQSSDAHLQASREADQYQNKVQNLKQQLADTAQTLFTIMLPTIQAVMDKIGGLINWFNNLSNSTKRLILITAGILAIASPILFYIGMLATGIGGLITALGVVAPAIVAVGGFLFSWVGILVAVGVGIALLASYVVKHWSTIKSWTLTTWNNIKSTISGVMACIQAFISGAVQEIISKWQAIKQRAVNAVDGIKSVFSAVYNSIVFPFVSAYNKVKEVAGAIKGLFQFKLSVPTVSVGGFHMNAKGGIFSQPVLLGGNNIVGEGNDSEAALPLNRKTLGGIGVGILSAIPDIGATGETTVINNNIEFRGTVRDNEDIKRIGQELYRLQQRENRSKGRSRI